MSPVRSPDPVRAEAMSRLLDYRERGRRRPVVLRALLAALGGLVLVASLPISVVLPEVGVPMLLVGLRLLAVEVDWAAKVYAWIDWRYIQAKRWFHRQSALVRAGVVALLLVLAAGLVWVLVIEFA